MEIRRKVKFEEELDKNFLNEIKKLSHCDEIDKCIQCGTCSSSCPMAVYMDMPPRKIISMVKNGFKDEVLRSATIWLCSSCYTCQVRCPADIKITDVMYALKRKAIEEKIYPANFKIPILAREMHRIIAKNGRSSELWLILNLYLKSKRPLGMLKMTSLGLNLLKTGRLPIMAEKIKNRKQFKGLLKDVKETAE
jgi:quinone-modifying oxidoreductase subunit QmoC